MSFRTTVSSLVGRTYGIAVKKNLTFCGKEVQTQITRSVTLVPNYNVDKETMNEEMFNHLRQRIKVAKEIRAVQRHHVEKAEDEAYLFLNIFLFFGIPSIILSLIWAVDGMQHEHNFHDKPDYMKRRNKPFPWSCSDCDYFDIPCWEKCRERRKQNRAAKEAAAAAEGKK